MVYSTHHHWNRKGRDKIMLRKQFRVTLSAVLAAVVCAGAVPLAPFVQSVHAVDIAATAQTEVKVDTVNVDAASAVLNGDVNGDGNVDAADADALSSVKLADCPQADVNADGVLDDVDADMIRSFDSGEIAYFPVGASYDADASYITRGAWIHALVQGFEMEMPDDAEYEIPYHDLEDSEYIADIRTAAYYGVFDILDENFHPEVYATRDFAAHTLNFCLGYPSTVSPLYSDADAVYYAGDAQIALERGWFATQGTMFCPSMYVTAAEGEKAYAEIDAALMSIAPDPDHADSITYASYVKMLTDASEASMLDNTVTLTGCGNALSEGDTFVFLLHEIEIIRKAEKVSYDEATDTLTVTTTDADEDAITECDVRGAAIIDYENIEVLYRGASFNINGHHVAYKPATITLPSQSFSQKFMNGNLTLSGEATNLQVMFDIQRNKLSVSSARLSVSADLSLTGKLASSLSTSTSDSVPLFNLPIVAGAGFSGNVVVSATASLSGELQLTYKCHTEAGVEYSGGSFRAIKSFHNKGFTMTATATEKLGVRVGLSAKMLNHELGQIYIGLGEQGVLKQLAQSNVAVICTNLSAWVYAEVGYNLDLWVAKNSNSYAFLNESNSPIRLNLHWENGKLVPNCSQGHNLSTVQSTNGGGSNGGAPYGGYASGSGYGSGYGYGSHGGWLNKYYGSMIAFKELEPPLIISEDMKLTEDLEVDTDLYIHAKLDLDGHKLTAKKNVYLDKGGQLIVNKGRAEVEGDLTFSSDGTSIIMENADDYVKINGTSHFKKGDSKFTAGTLEFAGDVVDSYITSSDMHKVILSATGDQLVSINDTTIGMLEIKHSDSRTIKLTKSLRVTGTVTVDGESLKIKCVESDSTPVLRLTKTNAKKLTIDGDITLGRMEVTDAEVTINGSVSYYVNNNMIDGDRYWGANYTLNQSKMTVNGDFDSIQRMVLNNSTLHVTGDYTFRTGSYGWIDGTYGGSILTMTHRDDKVIVDGDLVGKNELNVTDGIIQVGGNVTLADQAGFSPSGNNKLILTGEKDISIYMEVDNGLNVVEFENSDKRKIYADGWIVASKFDCGEKPLEIISREGTLKLGTVTCSKMHVEGDVTLAGALKLKCDEAIFDGNVKVAYEGTKFDLNGVPVTVNGTLSNYRTIYLHGAKLSVKNYTQTAEMLYMTEGKLLVSGNFSMSEKCGIEMVSAKDLIDVQGNMEFSRNESNDNITSGTVQLAGDIIASDDSGLMIEGNTKFILTGEKDQALCVSQIYTAEDRHHFGDLEIKNAASRTIILEGSIDALTIGADSDTVNITSNGGTINSGKLNVDLKVTGDLGSSQKQFDLNGHTVDITGRFLQTSGTVTPNTGKLLISGDYLMVKDYDSAVYSTSDATLNMVNDGDYVLVGGNFITKTTVNHSEYLTAGTLEIKGDFYQYSDGTEYAFPASGTHKVILSGEDVQHVTFESYDSSHFNILDMTQDASRYVLSDDPCWNALANGASGEKKSGDVNEDGSVDLKDVTLMRRALTGGWEMTINETNADVNGDDSFDLKDVTILRRYLTGGWDVTLS